MMPSGPRMYASAVCVLILHFTSKLSSVFEHVCNDSVNVIHRKHDTTEPQRVDGASTGPNLIA